MPRGIPEASLEERFKRRTVLTVCPVAELGDCWIWTGAKYTSGYGNLTKVKIWRTRYAHQWSCHHFNGSPLPLPEKHCIRHKCDIRACVNPAHLEYGTIYENIKDMHQRNPTAFNRIAPTPEELKCIQTMVHENVSKREMSRRINHSRPWIERVIQQYNL
jgi:hypothetical protein